MAAEGAEDFDGPLEEVPIAGIDRGGQVAHGREAPGVAAVLPGVALYAVGQQAVVLALQPIVHDAGRHALVWPCGRSFFFRRRAFLRFVQQAFEGGDALLGVPEVDAADALGFGRLDILFDVVDKGDLFGWQIQFFEQDAIDFGVGLFEADFGRRDDGVEEVEDALALQEAAAEGPVVGQRRQRKTVRLSARRTVEECTSTPWCSARQVASSSEVHVERR